MRVYPRQQTTAPFASPVGELWLEFRDEALVAVRWQGQATADPPPPEALHRVERWLRGYFAGDRSPPDFPMNPAGTPFQRRVWGLVSAIPWGECCTYGQLARLADSAPRPVGGAVGKNPLPILIPCHRVVARNGWGGYSGQGGVATKRLLLQGEVIPIDGGNTRTNPPDPPPRFEPEPPRPIRTENHENRRRSRQDPD